MIHKGAYIYFHINQFTYVYHISLRLTERCINVPPSINPIPILNVCKAAANFKVWVLAFTTSRANHHEYILNLCKTLPVT